MIARLMLAAPSGHTVDDALADLAERIGVTAGELGRLEIGDVAARLRALESRHREAPPDRAARSARLLAALAEVGRGR